MFCQKCGAHNAEDSKFCKSCGAPIEQTGNRNVLSQPAVQQNKQVKTPDMITQTQVSQQNAKTTQQQYIAVGNVPHYSAPPVKDYLVQSILVTLFCNLIFGVIAIVFSVLTSSAFNSGERMKAEDYSQKTKLFCWIGFWIGIASIALALLVFIVYFIFIMFVYTASGLIYY